MNGVPVPGRYRFVRSLVALAALALALGSTSTAVAHEGEEEVPALEFTHQAIAIIRSQPELVGEIEERIADAIESEDTDGVDLANVEAALESFEDGDMVETELLLEQAIGACPGETIVDPVGIHTPLPLGSPCPAPAHLSALDRAPVGGTARLVLLGFAAIAVLGGLYLVRRTHGHAW